MRYLHGARDIGLCFERDDSGIGNIVVGYVDSDCASDLDKKKSTIGYVFTMARANLLESILQSLLLFPLQRLNIWQLLKL